MAGLNQTNEQWLKDYDEASEMNLDELVPSTSKYLAKEDVGIPGKNLTIKSFSRETVGNGSDAEECAVIYWQEDEKPMILNKTNKNRIKHYLQATDSTEVIGKMINAYNDPEVEYGSKITGGLRLRGVQEIPAQNAGKDFLDDDINF